MKWIKKVAATPLDAVAKVIDSFSALDKINNAPSIRAVEDALDTKADSNDFILAVEDLTADLATKATKTELQTEVGALTDLINTKADKASMFIYRSYGTSILLQANSYAEYDAGSFNIEAIAGYTPTGFRRIHTGSRYALPYAMYARTSGTVLGLYNVSNSIVEGTAEIIIEYTRNDVRGS